MVQVDVIVRFAITQVVCEIEYNGLSTDLSTTVTPKLNENMICSHRLSINITLVAAIPTPIWSLLPLKSKV